MNIGIILLAAGSSSRMGQSKQLLSIQGELLLNKSIQAAVNSKAKEVVVVLGSDYETHRAAITNEEVDVIYNSNWETGMGSSLKKGLNYLLRKTPSLKAVITLVCDQPFLSASVVDSLIDEYQKTKPKIVACLYSGVIGVPALFDSSLFEELIQLPDEQGAKKLIQQHNELVATINFQNGIVDLDTREDYENFLRSDSL